MKGVTLCYGDGTVTVTTELQKGETRNGAAKRLRDRIRHHQNRQGRKIN